MTARHAPECLNASLTGADRPYTECAGQRRPYRPKGQDHSYASNGEVIQASAMVAQAKPAVHILGAMVL